jgi:hypothetical protein
VPLIDSQDILHSHFSFILIIDYQLRRNCIAGEGYNVKGSDIIQSALTCPQDQTAVIETSNGNNATKDGCVCQGGYYNSIASGKNKCVRCPLGSETGMRCNKTGLYFKDVVVDRHYFKTIHDDGKGTFRVSGTLCPNRDACPTNTSGETTGMNVFDEINGTLLNLFSLLLFCRVSYWLHRVLMCNLFSEFRKFQTSD